MKPRWLVLAAVLVLAAGPAMAEETATSSQRRESWVPVVAALAGTTLGGLISLVASGVQFARQQKAERRSILIAKLEETHGLLRSATRAYGGAYGDAISRLTIGKSLGRDMALIELDRFDMLVRFYFPELSKYADAIKREQRRFGELLAQSVLKSDAPKEERDRLYEHCSNRFNDLNRAISEALDAVAAVAHRLVTE